MRNIYSRYYEDHTLINGRIRTTHTLNITHAIPAEQLHNLVVQFPNFSSPNSEKYLIINDSYVLYRNDDYEDFARFEENIFNFIEEIQSKIDKHFRFHKTLIGYEIPNSQVP